MNILLSGLFPKAVEYKSFNRVSNPYECDIGGTYIKMTLNIDIEYLNTVYQKHVREMGNI